MRIAIFSDNFYPQLSGISDSIMTLGRELAKRGHFINYCVPKYPAADYEKAGVKNEEIDMGKNITVTRFVSVNAPLGNGNVPAIIPFGQFIKIKKFRPDVIHSQLFFGAGFEALLAAKILRIPMIGTNHTAITEYIRYAPFHPPYLNEIGLKYVNWYYNRCDFVTAPSASVFTEMLEHGFKKPYRVISNPIDTETFKPGPAWRKAALKKDFGFSEKTIIYAGRLTAEKSIDVLIKAVASAVPDEPGIMLALAGSGTESEKLKKLAEERGVSDNVKFLGLLSKERLAQAYSASEIFAIASTSETQSLTLMQALSCGLPAVAVRARALPEYVPTEAGFLVEPGNHKAFAARFIELLKNKETMEKMGRAAVKFAGKFSIPVISGEWEKLYAKISNKS